MGESLAWSRVNSELVITGRTSSQGFTGPVSLMPVHTDEDGNTRDNLDAFILKVFAASGNAAPFGNGPQLSFGSENSVDYFSAVDVTGCCIYAVGISQGSLDADGAISDAKEASINTVLYVVDLLSGTVILSQTLPAPGALHYWLRDGLFSLGLTQVSQVLRALVLMTR